MAFIGIDVEICPGAVKNFLSRLSASIAALQMLLTGSQRHSHQLSTVPQYVVSFVTTGLLLVLMIRVVSAIGLLTGIQLKMVLTFAQKIAPAQHSASFTLMVVDCVKCSGETPSCIQMIQSLTQTDAA